MCDLVTNCRRAVASERRQTLLFSATQTRKIEDLARISLKKEPLYVGVDDRKEAATVDGLEQVRLIILRTTVNHVSCVNCKNGGPTSST